MTSIAGPLGSSIRTRLDWRALAAVVTLAAALAGCGDEGDIDGDIGLPVDGNLFSNQSFESGAAPWISLESAAWGPPFTVSDAQSRSGDSSALLKLRSEDGPESSALVYGVVQEISPEELPEVISGYYFVDGWEQGTEKQYLQFVVIAFESENVPAELGGVPNHQIRYVLAGVDQQPLQISNARYVMLGTGEPKQGEWVRFERNIREDFEQLWGEVPRGFTNLRLLFEVRWDGRTPTDGPSRADVFYDELYIGPARDSGG